jgi:uncharacterized protein YeaO (DUF488 family)
MPFQIKRVYEPPAPSDGCRVLVDRLWPRGLKKEKAKIDLWLKEIAPSTALRQWFGHKEQNWPEFQKRYLSELKKNTTLLQSLSEKGHAGTVTLLYAARDDQHNNACLLKDYLARKDGAK